jgi:uncharacterized membrane protein
MQQKALISLCIMLATFAWWALMEWQSYRSWKKHKSSGFVPGTQHLVMLSCVGIVLGIIATLLVFIFV